MATLQKTIGYAGDPANSPFSDVELQFQLPVYAYSSEAADGSVEVSAAKLPKVSRRLVATDVASMTTTVDAKTYRLSLPDDFLVGDDPTLFQIFVLGSVSSKSIENLAVSIDVDYLLEGTVGIGTQSLDLLYFPKLSIDAQTRKESLARSRTDDLFKSVLLVGKAAFYKLLKKVSSAAATLDEITLLEVVSLLTDVTNEQPGLDMNVAAAIQEKILALLKKAGFEDPAAAFEGVKSGFDSLFDLPLTIPAVSAVVVAGTFTVQTSDGSKISPQDLLPYELTAEYSVLGSSELQIRRYSFRNVAEVPDNSTPFSFSDDPGLFRESITSSILIKVRGIDGSPVWSKAFKASDPNLDKIAIKVPLQRANSLTPVDDPTIRDRAKKLRGQVLDLSKKCTLKDLTVLIQAKAEGDASWRVVGAATTGASGNFSMSYPYGIYTAAQALVSLTPDNPAPVGIVEVQQGNQTIADDFLYLLATGADCEQEDTHEDCDCTAAKKPSRLPDYADLIGSSEYSQDIGGSCVNLSTPNRTLSEFNYQAIVRTSDPEVSNYTLQKIEPLIAEVATSLNALSAANISTNAVVHVLSGLNADLNASLNPLDAAGNSASNSLLVALNQVLSPLNAALEPLRTAPVAALSLSLGALATALSASNGFNSSLNAAIDPLKNAITASTAAANAALQAAFAVAKPAPNSLFDFLTGTQNAGLNALFNPLNGAIGASGNEEAAKAAAELKAKLNVALAAANAALNSALSASQTALNAALNAQSTVNVVDAATRYELTGGAKKITRKAVDLDNAIAWQDAPDEAAGASLMLDVTSPRREIAMKAGGKASAVAAPKNRKNLSFYQAVTVATGHILHYKSLFKADGYSLGDLIYSLPLAPGQKKEIVVFDSSHTLQGSESQLQTQGESLSASIANERDVLTQLSGTLSESLRGTSSANTSGISAGFGTGGQGSGSSGAFGGSGSAVIGVAGGTANANSTAAQDSSRVVSQFFADKLRQSIMQNAESYRQLNASVVTTVKEGQSYGVTSEVVANHNHCHALTMMYFEVLRHYAIYQDLSSVEECVFVPLLMTNFTTQNIYKWRDVLARFLLPMPSETYLQTPAYLTAGRQHPLLRAFDANERIKSQYANVDFPEGSYDDERIQFIKGTLRLLVELPRPRTRFDRIMSFPLTKQLDVQALAADALKYSKDMAAYSVKAAVTGGLWTLFDPPKDPPDPQRYEVVGREAIFDAFMSIDANFQSVPPAQCIRITNFNPPAQISLGVLGSLPAIVTKPLDFFAENKEDKDQWQAYADVLGYQTVLEMLQAYFSGNLISEWDSIFYNDIAPLVFEKIVNSLNVSGIATDFASEAKYKGGERQILLNLTGATSLKRNQFPQRLHLSVNNSKLSSLHDFTTLSVRDVTLTYSTAHYNGTLYSGSVNNDLLDGSDLYIPENTDEKRNPRKEDAYLVSKLIEHLNSNLEYYNKVLWFNLDPDRRYMLLDGFGIQTYNDFGLPVDPDGNPIPLRSLASVVKNELVTITGNSMVFPVAAGYRVGKDYIVERKEEDEEGEKTKIVTLLEHYQPLTPIEPFRISVPSKGVFAEAVQGACNACEKIENERLQDWTRFPNTDEPTSISPISTPVPVITDWKAAFKDFATPIVNIQNAPTAPDPGTGLAGLTELLGKAGVFKDITGLDANQQNAIKTYLSNQENAKAFAEMAKEMAMQSHNTQNSGKILDSIAQAKTAGDISKEDAGKLVKDHLMQQIDGGQTKRTDLAKSRQMNPLTQAVLDASSQGLPFKASVSDPEGGLVESVQVGNPDDDTSAGGGGGTIKSKIDRALSSLLEQSTGAGDRPLKLLEGNAADEKVARLLLKAQPKTLTDGTEIVPGTIIGGRTMIVDADDTFVYYVKDGALWEWGTQRFFRTEYISAQMEALVGVEPLVKLAYIEIAFLSGLFAGPELLAEEAATTFTAVVIQTVKGGALIAASQAVDKGLKLYHYRAQVGDAYQVFRRVLAARDCLHDAVPEMMDRLESKIEWETLKSIPSQFTAKEVAFWLGRCLRGTIMLDGNLAFLSIAKAVALTSALLVALDTAVGTPAAFAAALDTQAQLFVAKFADDTVKVSNAEAKLWLQALRENPQARTCLVNFAKSLEELTPILEAMRPDLVL
jgi:hypothetical protein